jgi:hypothetical protein
MTFLGGTAREHANALSAADVIQNWKPELKLMGRP